MLLSFFAAKTLQSIREAQWAKGLLSNSIMRILMVYFLLSRLKMLLRFLLLATTVLLLVKTKVKANEDSQKPSKPGPPPPSFVAVVPTSIMGDFDGALFPFLIEETTTTTTTTTPAPFGTFTAIFTILLKPSNTSMLNILVIGQRIIIENVEKNGLVCG